MANERSYPATLTGLYKNDFSEKLVLNGMPIDRERADQMCAAIQAAVGGIIEVREWGGKGKTGKDLPPYKLQVLTAEQLAERKAYAAAKKAEEDI